MIINRNSNQFCPFTLDIHRTYLDLKIKDLDKQMDELKKERDRISKELNEALTFYGNL